MADDPDVRRLAELRCDAAVTVVHLINRRTAYQSESKDYEFSRRTMEEHWAAGREDVAHTFKHREWFDRDKPATGVHVFDLSSADHDHD
jgi:NTE family protein